MSTFEKSMDFINEQFETQKKISENLLKSNAKLEEENKSLRKQVGKLEGAIGKVQNEVDELEQYGRRDMF